MRTRLLIFAFVICVYGVAMAQTQHLRSGFVVCEAPGQLRWFVGLPSIDGLWRQTPHRRPLPVTFEDKTAQKALQNGWCKRTRELAQESVRIVASCDDNPLGKYFANGGCRQISLRGREWYTFANALFK
jgi:hypothetical protein